MSDAYEWPAENECLWCREPLLPGERLAPDPVSTSAGWRRQHLECAIRSIAGGLNHLQGRCSCCGGTLPPDPEGLTRREAARIAAQVWLTRNPQRED